MTRQGNIWRQKASQDFHERKAYVKARARYNETVAALNLDTDLGDECPICCGFTLNPCADDRGAYCDNPACRETFDMIKLVIEQRDVSWRDAVVFLEENVSAPRDGKTGDLLEARS